MKTCKERKESAHRPVIEAGTSPLQVGDRLSKGTERAPAERPRRHALWIIPVVVVLGLSMTACENGNVENEQTGLYESDQEPQTQPTEDVRMVGVSVTRTGSVMPILPAGRASFTVENQGTSDCILTLTPRPDMASADPAAGGMERGGSYEQPGAPADDPQGRGQEAAPPEGMDPERMEDEGMEGEGMQGEGMDDPTRGEFSDTQQAGTRVAAGQESTVTLELRPGTYEVSCEGETAAGGVSDDEGMLLTVTEEHRGVRETQPQDAPGAAPNTDRGRESSL